MSPGSTSKTTQSAGNVAGPNRAGPRRGPLHSSMGDEAIKQVKRQAFKTSSTIRLSSSTSLAATKSANAMSTKNNRTLDILAKAEAGGCALRIRRRDVEC